MGALVKVQARVRLVVAKSIRKAGLPLAHRGGSGSHGGIADLLREGGKARIPGLRIFAHWLFCRRVGASVESGVGPPAGHKA